MDIGFLFTEKFTAGEAGRKSFRGYYLKGLKSVVDCNCVLT